MSRKSSNSVAIALSNEEKKLIDELSKLEKQIYLLETSYLENTANIGNLVRGWSEFLSRPSNKKNNQNQKKKIQHDEDRIFSLSSTTSKSIIEAEQNKKRRDNEDDTVNPQKKRKRS